MRNQKPWRLVPQKKKIKTPPTTSKSRLIPCWLNLSLGSSPFWRLPRVSLYLRQQVSPSILRDSGRDSMAIMILKVSFNHLVLSLVASSIDQWVDYINTSVAPLSLQVSQSVFGHDTSSDMKSFSIALGNLKKSLVPIEKHLKLRNFLVGYSLTLADVTLLVNLINPLQTVLDSGFRKETIPNLSRYCQIILEGRSFTQTFGRIHFAKKMLQPQLNKPIEAVKTAPKAVPAKEAKATPAKKETSPQSTAPATPKEESWEDRLPPINEKFNLFEFKTLIVNHKTKREALQTLWQNWDNNAFSFYFVHYQKY